MSFPFCEEHSLIYRTKDSKIENLAELQGIPLVLRINVGKIKTGTKNKLYTSIDDLGTNSSLQDLSRTTDETLQSSNLERKLNQ